MPRKYIRKTIDKYSKEVLDRAISLVRDQNVSVSSAAEQCHVPKRTLYNRLSNTNGAGGRGVRPILTKEEESLLIHTITVFQLWQQPLTRLSLIELARGYMLELKKPISTKSTLCDWFQRFMKRCGEEIKLAKSMKLEKVRSTSCTKETISER